MEQSSLLTIPLAFFIGILASLTPCIYPVIPILVGYMGSAAGRSRLRTFLLSVFYVVGMAFTFSVLGAMAAGLGHIFGLVQASPWTNIAVGIIVTAFGVALIGVFSLPVPSFLTSRQTKLRRGYLGAALMGAVSGMITGPCTVAIVGPLLVYVASTGNVVYGGVMFFSFAMGMGVLLIAVGTFTGLLAALPRSGAWIRKVELVFGVAMVLLGLGYFVGYKGVFMLAYY